MMMVPMLMSMMMKSYILKCMQLYDNDMCYDNLNQSSVLLLLTLTQDGFDVIIHFGIDSLSRIIVIWKCSVTLYNESTVTTLSTHSW